jgi:hypothetical protein
MVMIKIKRAKMTLPTIRHCEVRSNPELLIVCMILQYVIARNEVTKQSIEYLI